MEAGKRCEENKNKSKIENTTDGESDQCAEDGALKDPEFVGFVFDESFPMLVRSAMVSKGVRELEFDMSYMNAQALKELDSIASPSDQLLPLHLPLHIQMVEKFLSSEVKRLEPHASTQTKNMGNRKDRKHKSRDVSPCKIGKEWKETNYSKGSAPALYGNQSKKLIDSSQSEQTALADKFKAWKQYLKSLFSKAFKSRANDHHDDAATVGRSSQRENLYTTHRKSFSGSFSFIKGFPLKAKPNSNASPAHSAAFLKRGMNIANNANMENDIQGAISHCKQSHIAVSRSMIDNSKYVQQNTSIPEGYADGPVHGRSWSGSRISACDLLEKPGLGQL